LFVAVPAKDAAGFVIAPVAGHLGQRGRALGAFQQQSVGVEGQYAGGSVAIPPFHQHAAEAFLLLGRQLEHRRLAAAPHRQQVTAVGDNGAAVENQIPSVEIGVEHGR
jgi:hypothetical protein